jgi:hypothetical protein
MAKKPAARKSPSASRKRAGSTRSRSTASRQAGASRKKSAAAGRKTSGARKAAARKAAARKGAGRKASARKTSSSKTSARKATTRKTGTRKTAARKTAARKTGARKVSARKAAAPRSAAGRTAARKAGTRKAGAGTRRPRVGGTGDERTLAQTPETGRTVKGPTNPMPTIRSTGTPAGSGETADSPGLTRSRRRLRRMEETLPGVPSSLDLDRSASAVRSGRQEMREARREHNETSPVLTGGDIDADWEDAYAVGDEAPGGDNPTPDQDRVDDIGKALGVQYEDNEELKAADKIAQRDRHRWELDPASSDDYNDRD